MRRDDFDGEEDRRERRVAWVALAVIVLFILVSCLASCSRKVYVPAESVRTEYVSGDTSQFMSLISLLSERLREKERLTDSLMRSYNERLVVNDRGDTLRLDTERIIYRSTGRETELEKAVESKSDSIRELRQRLESVKRDSVAVPYPVERELTRWERAKMDFGGIAMGASGLLAVILCAAVVWRIRRRISN